MYYVNRQQIDNRLDQAQLLEQAVGSLTSNWSGSIVDHLAQERALHIAIEIVTDVGSLLIDGFILRDASSYEDIVDIIAEAGAMDEELHQVLIQLVALRRPLVQDYEKWKREGVHPLFENLDVTMRQFSDSVHRFLQKELPALQV
ncbi:DUF86 domain-containing protein [Paenibacillus agilis]|uniref:DUF86 domain-containing protein n=1 Tax=Paenibacillus agilis TaxID=3020863 RepID=A0A559IY05_9BACL|nr:HepT-like ribonuclease domain-containing protein [Paenibacillus agilis]TVX92508.1 DUF86 domain-containing protein [Paenibacillus agilis]